MFPTTVAAIANHIAQLVMLFRNITGTDRFAPANQRFAADIRG
jgi:hypothetical protein